MSEHVLAIPLPSNQITSGDRGIPEMDFDILNQIQSKTRSRLGTLQNRAHEQQHDLSTILEGVNTTVKDTRKRKRDSDLMFTQQANELAVKSDQIRQNAMEAAADPFNELKALFGDTLSMAEWAARHNSVQNELSAVKRRFTASAAGYNFDLEEAAGKIQFSMQKLAFTKENISGITAANQAILTTINAQSAMFTQQLDTMHTKAELQAELNDPNGEIPKDLVRRRILILDLALEELKTARAAKGKSLLEIKKMELDIIQKHPELLSVATAEQAIQSNQNVIEPNTGITITPQIAKIIRVQQKERAQIDAKLTTSLLENQMRATHAFAQIAAVLGRSGGAGVNVFARDEQGFVTGFNPDAVSAEMRQDAAAMFDLQTVSQTLQNTLQDPTTTPEVRKQIRTSQFAINQQVHELRNKIVKKAKADIQLNVEDKEAKKSASRWVEFGNIQSIPGAKGLLIEGATSVISGVESTLSTAHGAGWGEGLIVFGAKFNADIASAGKIFDAEGKVDKDKITALRISDIDLFDLTFQNALGEVNANGDNKIQAAILSDFYEVTMVRGVREMEARHAAEPETVSMLKSLILGTVALDPGITTMPNKDKKGEFLDSANVLFATLALKEKQLQEVGTLPKTSTLVHELQSILLGDVIGNPELGQSIYDLPEIVSLTIPTSMEGASLNFLFFRNKIKAMLQRGLQNIVRSIPLSKIDVSRQIVDLETEFKELGFQGGLRPSTPADEEQRRAIRKQIQSLQDEQGGRSLTSIMQQLLTQQE